MKRFDNNARVCFIGDSITHANRFVAHIVAYYREHFPEAKVEFYNCGIAGGTVNTILNAFDEDIRNYNPTHVVLMIGINDSGYNALNALPERKYEELKRAYDNYKINLDKLCEKLKEMGTSLTLCTPMPYDEYMKSSEPTLPGGCALLLGYAEFIKKYAQDHGYPVCDYHSYATSVMQREVIFNPDRVHPNANGHYHMAKCFLKFQGYELGEEKELPSNIQKWHEAVLLLRDTITTEHLIMKDNFSVTQEEGVAAVKHYLESEHTEPYAEIYKGLAKRYIDTKPKQQDYLKFVIDFMKN